MIELLVLAALGFAALIVVGVVVAGLWLIFLPFRILGWMLKGVGLLLCLPFMLLFGTLGVVIFGVGMVFFMVPVLPFALLVWLVWRALRRAPAPVST